jgi:tetratricopeptide (TPR) repeat protein
VDLLTAMERLHTRRPEFWLEFPIAERQLAAGAVDLAHATCEAGLAAKPGYYQLHLTLGKIAQHEGRVGDAITEFERVLQASPENRLAAKLLLPLLIQTGRSREVPALLSRFPDLAVDAAPPAGRTPGDDTHPAPPPTVPTRLPTTSGPLPRPFVNPTVAELYCSQGHPDKAAAIYEELLRLRPHDAAIRARLAALRHEAGPPSVETR